MVIAGVRSGVGKTTIATGIMGALTRRGYLVQPFRAGPDYIDRVFAHTDRSIRVMRNLQAIFNTGRLAGTGYVSLLPVDQGIEHTAGASFAPNPIYFDPENIVKLAIEGGCNAVASTLGVLGSVARRYAHKIPFLVKLNHNELLTYPNTYDQIMFADVEQAADMGAAAVGATIYFGSEESNRQIQEVSEAFHLAHGLVGVDFDGTVVWQRQLPSLDNYHGSAGSLILYGDTVILYQDHAGQSFVAAFDTGTGETRWWTDRQTRIGWGTPIVKLPSTELRTGRTSLF